MQFATNHLGHFLLTQLLLDNLVATAKTTGGANTRVVVLSSMAHFSAPKEGVLAADALDSEKVYQNWTAYGQSKLCNVLFTRELNKRLTAAGTPVTVACCHPGCIPTELGRYFPKWLYATFKYLPFKSIPQGTATQVRATGCWACC